MIEIYTLLLLGIVVVFGLFLGKVTQRLRITSIVGYIIAGIVLGPVTHIIAITEQMGDLIVTFTLALVGFVIGASFTRTFLREVGKSVFWITLWETSLAFIAVTLGLYLLTRNLSLALIFGALAPASAPAGTIAAIRETKAKGILTDIAIGVVGFDDVWSIGIFVVAIGIVRLLISGEFLLNSLLEVIFIELCVAIALGFIMGACLAYITKKILKNKEDIFVISIGFIILCAGIAKMIGASTIMASMALGVTFVNLNPWIGRTAHRTIENILPPIFVIFFVVAGLELRPWLLTIAGVIGVVYIVCRILGLYSGAFFGSRQIKAPLPVQKYLGFAILSQAGVAIGLALLIHHELAGLPGGKELSILAITVITATSVVFEIIGPIGTRFAVTKAGETPSHK